MVGKLRGVGSTSPSFKGVSAPKAGVSPSKGDQSVSKDPIDKVDLSLGDISKDTLEKIPDNVLKYFSKGNKVTPLFDPQVTPNNEKDDIFCHVKQMISGAKKSIQVEMFGLDRKDLVDLLISEAKSGKKVQLILDPPNEDWEAGKKEAIEKLVKSGVDVKIYPTKSGQIDHVKMLIVDGKEAIIGGMNWGEHSRYNHDYDVKVEGPAVDDMEWMFRKDWIKSGGDPKELPWIEDTPAHPDGGAWVNVITTSDDPKDQTIGKTINRAIRNAKKSVHAELFVLTDKETIYNLIKAHERGVDVRVILNPLKINDFPINEKAARILKRAGVPVRWYRCNPDTQEKLHAKIAIIDDDQTIVQSANWTRAGFTKNREAGVEVLSKKVNRSFEDIFMSDWENKTTEEPIYIEEPDNTPGG